MSGGLRLGVASQTPLVRMKRTLDELETKYGPLGNPVSLDRLERGVDYSVTPGGVARMLQATFMTVGRTRGLHGEWVALSSGFPRDLHLEDFRLSFATLAQEDRAGYGQFKEMIWEALNGLPPRLDAPLQAVAGRGEGAESWRAFETWSRENARRLLASHEEEPFDIFYVNDWQHLPQGRMLEGRPRLMHYHAPFAGWTPPGWRDFVVHFMRDFDAVIVSTRQAVRALGRAGLERPVYRVYPWIDPADYPVPEKEDVRELEERYGIGPEDEIVLNVGRMDPIKGQDRLIRALPRLLRSRPHAKLLIVGNGSFSSSKKGGMGLSKGARWRARLEAMTRELGMEERVVFTGHLPHRLVLPAFHRADVFAFPSVAEGFGLAVAEAWLAEKPVVVDPGAGVTEIVEDGVNGVLADTGDPVAFADALARVLALPDGGAAMGEAGRRTAIAECDVRVRAAEVLEILEAHAERRKPDVEPSAAVARKETLR